MVNSTRGRRHRRRHPSGCRQRLGKRCTETKPARWRPELDVDARATVDELAAALNQRMAAPIRVRRRADAIRHAITFALDAERR